jgi:hypothetical protein
MSIGDSIRASVDFTSLLRASLLALLDEMRTAQGGEELHIDHNRRGKYRSCGFRAIRGKSLVYPVSSKTLLPRTHIHVNGRVVKECAR